MIHALRFAIGKRVLVVASLVPPLGLLLSTGLAATTVTQVAAGGFHAIFVKSDGSLWGMGYNGQGQLGLGFGLSQTNLPQLLVNSNVSAVAAGENHSLFLESNGSLWAMGENIYGQLGDGTTNNQYLPEQLFSSGGEKVAAGYYHSLFTTAIGPPVPVFTLWAMGDNGYDELGDGSTMSHDTPEQIQSTELLAEEVTAIAGGGYHSLYVREDGSLWAAGYNFFGELGDGTNSSPLSYEEILSTNVTAVAAGTYHSLFLESDGSLWAMGNNTYGQLGDNSTVDKHSPEQVGVNAMAIAAGYGHSLFIESDGSLWAMGWNYYGQLGDGTTTGRPLPVQIVSSNVVAVAAGEISSFFIKSDGSLWAMGDNVNGQLGDGTYIDRHFPVQIVPLVIPQPAITNISLATTNLVLSGTNGESGRTYYTLMSTNLAPLNQWTPVATNVLSTDGVFTFTATNAVVPNVAQRFYALRVQ